MNKKGLVLKLSKDFTLSLLNGFSLIEVIIFVSILSLFFVVAAAVSSASIRNIKISEHKMIASYYADELMEWLRYQKISNWPTFSGYSSESGNTFCFSTLDWDRPGNCISETVGLIYNRYATLTAQDNPISSISVEVVVEWNEPGSTSYSVKQKNLFNIYE